MKNPDTWGTQPAPPVSSEPPGRSLYARILLLTIPLALSRQLENLVGMADIFMVGKLGPEAISAVGISRSITMVISASMISITTGTFAMVARFIGAGSGRDASATAKQSFTLLTLLTIGISLPGIVGAPYFLTALSVSPEIVALGTPFLQVFFAGTPLMTLNRAVSSCLYGAGNTRTPFYINTCNNASKIVFSYLLIFGVWGFPRLGVTGAAVGTLIGWTCGLVLGLWALYSGRFGMALLPGTSYRPNLALARRILKIGIPSSIQGFLRNGSRLVLVKLIALTASSTAAVAAYSIGSQMERVLRHPSLAFSTSATTLVGQSLGAGNPEQAERWGWATLRVSILTAVILALPVALFARPIIAFFTDAPEVIEIGVVYLYAIALAEPLMGVANTCSGSLRGAGDTLPPMYYTLISQWLVRLPVSYLLAFTLGYDINGIWAAYILFSALQGVLTVRKFQKGEWKEREI